MRLQTDLAMEAAQIAGHLPQGVRVEEQQFTPDVHIHRVHIDDEQGQQAIGKPPGTYITIQAQALTGADADVAADCTRALSQQLQTLFVQKPNRTRPVLVVGLGNRAITPDSLGPRVLEHLLVTRHMFALVPEQVDQRAASVAAIAPGVLGETGLESGEVIAALVRQVQPSMVIAIDALAALSPSRLATTVQLSDTGIAPGAGIGNQRPRLDQALLGVPVIAIGVPTVVHAASLVIHALTDTADEAHQQALQQSCGDLIVTPKDIDTIIQGCATVVARGLNMALHGDLALQEAAQLFS